MSIEQLAVMSNSESKKEDGGNFDLTSPVVLRNMVERASLIKLLRLDQNRLAAEIASLEGKSGSFASKKKEILERQLEGMDQRLRRAIVLEFC